MSLFTTFLDVLVPPRPTEELVRHLTATELYALTERETHTLPYHDMRVTALVWELKYYAHPRALALASEYRSEHVLGIAGEELGKPLLVPIPMHEKRRKARGHNQTEVLCEALIKHLGPIVEYVPRALVRIKETVPQQGLERARRLKNAEGSMESDAALVHNRVCIVIDDVQTTGATLAEAKRALRQAGALRVHLVTLAHS